MGLRKNVAVASGDLYPNGIKVVPPNPNVQATVRPQGTFFHKSVGYETIRPGNSAFDHNHHGLGIHFTPMRFAEDVGEFDSLPLLVDATTAADHADIAELPGSEMLGPHGELDDATVNSNGGVKIAESGDAAAPASHVLHKGNRTLLDMGDREPGRPLTRDFHGLLRNPVGVFKSEYQEDPTVAVAAAGVIVGVGYFLLRELEGNFRRRTRSAGSGGGVSSVAAPAAGAVAASADTAGSAVKEAADVVNKTATAAGEAVETAVSAAGDTVKAAGDAVDKATDAAADAVTE